MSDGKNSFSILRKEIYTQTWVQTYKRLFSWVELTQNYFILGTSKFYIQFKTYFLRAQLTRMMHLWVTQDEGVEQRRL